jgi:hypothetical protein
MWDYYVYLVLGVALVTYWLVAAYLPEIKAYIKRFCTIITGTSIITITVDCAFLLKE